MEKASRGVSRWRGRGKEGRLVLLVLASESHLEERGLWRDKGRRGELGERGEKSEMTEREKERKVSIVKERVRILLFR